MGDAPIIAVNDAAREMKALFLFSQHPERLVTKGWIRNQQRIFGDGFTVHSQGADTVPAVDYWWPIKRTGGSAWAARKVAVYVGFDVVILCGCPITPGPYVGNHNIGGMMGRADAVDTLLQQITVDAEWHEGAYSMSGRTRDLLGEPG